MADERICITEARRACILVVDDQPLVAALIADLLALEGYEVETAKNGREALEKIAGRSYDLILSDLQMPELDGVGLYHELERQRPSLLPRLAFVSGSTEVPEYASFASGRPSHCWASLSPSTVATVPSEWGASAAPATSALSLQAAARTTRSRRNGVRTWCRLLPNSPRKHRARGHTQGHPCSRHT